MLAARNLACLRGERAVFAGLDVSLPQGSALLLTGANGAGKSTLLRVLAGLLRPAEGAVLWQGEDIAADPAAHARRLRYLSHQDALKPALTVAENLAFFAALWGGAVAGALESCHDMSGGTVPYSADDLKKARKGDHVSLVFTKSLEVKVLGRKLEVSEVVFADGVFWLLCGNEVVRCTKYESDKMDRFQKWHRQTLPVD